MVKYPIGQIGQGFADGEWQDNIRQNRQTGEALNMTVREILRRPYELKKRTEICRRRILDLRELAEKTTAAYESVYVHSGGEGKSRLADCVVKMSSLEEELAKATGAYLMSIEQVSEMLAKIGRPELRQVLEYRYLCFLKWEQIACEMNYSWRHIMRMHKEGLRTVEDAS